MKKTLVAVALVMLMAASAQAAGTLITNAYSGADLLPLHFGPGNVGATDDGGVTYGNWGTNDEMSAAVIDNDLSSGKWFESVGGGATTDDMDSNAAPTNNAWWTAHFDTAKVISHIVIGTQEHEGRDPDQFQIRGSNDGSNWVVIYRYDNNEVNAGFLDLPGPAYSGLQFDAGTDFTTPAAYTQIRLEIFSARGSMGYAAVSEWQIAGSPVPELATVPEPAGLGLLGLALLAVRKRRS